MKVGESRQLWAAGLLDSPEDVLQATTLKTLDPRPLGPETQKNSWFDNASGDSVHPQGVGLRGFVECQSHMIGRRSLFWGAAVAQIRV